MKKLLTSAALICVAAVPATASAQTPAPTPDQFKNASKFCKALKTHSGPSFSTMYKNHGKCVSSVAKKDAAEDAKQAKTAKTSASKACRDERAADPAAFKAKYQEKGNGIGKCVSKQARANKAAADKQDKAEAKNTLNAAKTCKAERGTTTESKQAFADKYGTNASKKNAFGKCVSKTAKANEQEQAPAQS